MAFEKTLPLALWLPFGSAARRNAAALSSGLQGDPHWHGRAK